MAEDWSQEEVNLITYDYFDMLKQELRHLKYNKAAHNRALMPRLDGRSRGSIEFKHQNISAALTESGKPYIKGYKPLPNNQKILVEAVSRYVERHHAELNELFTNFVTESIPDGPTTKIDFRKVLDTPPERSEEKTKNRSFKAFRINYLQMEQEYRRLGLLGEQFVFEYEKWRLSKAGHTKLAKKIKWVSRDEGDGPGYDILSKNADGTDRYIEVKTTKLSKESPIFVSANEIAFAEKNPDSFYLYRVFDAVAQKRMFIHRGPYDQFCRLEAVSYRGVFYRWSAFF